MTASPDRYRFPYLWDNPIIGREVGFRLFRRASPLARAALVALSAALSLAAGIALDGVFEDQGMLIAYYSVYAWTGLTVVVAALQASRSIAQERMAGTWDALVMSRLGARGIVFGKLFGVLLPLWAVGLLFVLVALPMTLVSDDPFAAGYCLVVACGVALFAGTAAASVGLYCSMRCRTIMSAQLLTVGLGLVLGLVPGFILLWYLVARFNRIDGYHRGLCGLDIAASSVEISEVRR